MKRFYVQLALVTALVYGAQCSAGCLLLQEGTPVPKLVKRSECVELQGHNEVREHLTVEGKLIVKYGTILSLPSNLELTVKSHGELEVRGEFKQEENSLLRLDEFGKLSVFGQMYVQPGATVLSERSASFVLPGKVMFRPVSYLKLGRDVSLKSGGILNFDKTKVDADSCSIDNSGTISVMNRSILELQGNTRIRNRGTLLSEPNTMINIQDRSYLDNERKVSFNGVVNFSGASSLQNRFIFTVDELGKVSMSDGVTFGNNHIVNLNGSLNLDDHAKYDNFKNLQLGKKAVLSIRGNAVLTNRGTVYDRGTVKLEYKENLKNKHIFFINDLKQSSNVEEVLYKMSRSQNRSAP
ncbi:MAG: hypothetical protein K6F05_09445 [Succinivibrio sp.]|nr:hypothetical protein [Succinivibrio sp.]